MKRMVCAFVSVVAIATVQGVNPRGATAGSTPIAARMTFTNGSVRTVNIQGVGCSEALCSRVVIRSRVGGRGEIAQTWLDTIAAIQDIRAQDALFVFKDGTRDRRAVVFDNRFLYYTDQHGAGKIDIAGVKSIEFVPAGR